MDGTWYFPPKAYVSDDDRAFASRSLSKITYRDYDFEDDIPVGSTINEVWAILEGYVSHEDYGVSFRVSQDGGTFWSAAEDFGLTTSETSHYFNITDPVYLPPFTRDMLTNENFRIRLSYYTGGCYLNRTYFVTWNDQKEMPYVCKNVEKIKVNDTLLAYNTWNGFYLNKVTQVDVHAGNWTVFDIQSGELKIKYNVDDQELEYEFKSHSHLTANHPLEVIRNDERIRVNASTVRIGDKIAHVTHEAEFENETYQPIKNHTLKLFDVEKIREYTFEGNVYSIYTDNPNDRLFSKFLEDKELKFLEKIGVDLGLLFDPETFQKWTVYVDHLPVRVTFTEVDLVCIPCLFIGLCFVIGIMILVIVLSDEKR